MVKKRCIVVPTNRECVQSIEAYVAECNSVQNNVGEECDFVLVDTSDKITRSKHAEKIKNIRKNDSQVKILHYCNDEIEMFLEKILFSYGVSDVARIKKILNPHGLSYGAAANKTFLLAAMLGCNILSRRDSDTLPQIKNDSYLFPSDLENDLLGKKLYEIETRIRINDYQDNPEIRNKEILMVGANYLGEWAGDYREMYEYNPEILHRHVWMNMPDKTSEEVTQRIKYRYLERDNDEHQTDILDVVRDDLIEVGNFALKDVFLDVPLIPSVNALSMDYFYHSLFDSVDLPKLYHNRHVLHFHTTERGNYAWFERYHLGIAKSKIMRRYLARVYKSIEKDKGKICVEHRFDNRLISNIFYEVSEMHLDENIKLLDELYELYNSIEIDKYKDVAEQMKNKKQQLLDESRNDIEDFAFLLEHWKGICECAMDLGNSEKRG